MAHEILVDTTVAGDIAATGYISGKQSGAYVYALNQNTTIPTADVWITTAGTKTIPVIEDFSPAVTYTPGIKYDGTIQQLFKIDWAVAYAMNAASATIHFSVFKNGVEAAGSEMETFGKNINQVYNLSGHAAIYLEAGDEVQLKVKSNKTGTLNIKHETTTINEFFKLSASGSSVLPGSISYLKTDGSNEAVDINVEADGRINLEGLLGDSYIVYNSTAGEIEIWVNGVKVVSW